jgi:hypothetical protein
MNWSFSLDPTRLSQSWPGLDVAGNYINALHHYSVRRDDLAFHSAALAFFFARDDQNIVSGTNIH